MFETVTQLTVADNALILYVLGLFMVVFGMIKQLAKGSDAAFAFYFGAGLVGSIALMLQIISPAYDSKANNINTPLIVDGRETKGKK